MTIICALHRDGRTWIGSDTFSRYQGCRVYHGPKWVFNSQWAVGLAGDQASHVQLERHSDRLLGNLSDPGEFTTRLYGVFKEADYDLKPVDNDATPNCCQDMLLAGHDGVWIVTATFSFLQVPGFWAQGIGKDIALGAAFASKDKKPQYIVELATRAAIELSTGCDGEVWVHELTA